MADAGASLCAHLRYRATHPAPNASRRTPFPPQLTPPTPAKGPSSLPTFFTGPAASPPGGVGLPVEEDLDDLAFGDDFDIPLAGLPEFFGSEGGGGGGGGARVDRVTAIAEFDSLAEITGEESGARAALGMAPAASASSAEGGGGVERGQNAGQNEEAAHGIKLCF